MQDNNENKVPLDKLWKISEGYKGAYQPDVEKGLAKFKARIATTKSTTKVVQMPRRQWFGRIAASVAILLTFGVLANWFLNTNQVQQVASTNSLIDNIQLPDGSIVVLNKNSELTYPKSFTGSNRVVELKGEAFFKVARNTNKPFIVSTTSSEVKVLGTEFNVRAYPSEVQTIVEVEEGKVAVKLVATEKEQILVANDKVLINHADATLSKVEALDWKDTAWKAKQLVFENKPISDVLDYLMYNFEVEVDYNQEKLGTCLFNTTLVKNTPEAILKQLDSAFPILKLKKVHSKYYQLSGNACN